MYTLGCGLKGGGHQGCSLGGVASPHEIDKHMITDRQSLEKNVIIFKMEGPNTNLIKERQAKDLEALNEMIEQIAVESEEDIKIDKIIRLGTRRANYKDNLRSAIVSFSTIESKKMFRRN